MEISENFTTALAVKLIIYYFLEKTTRLLFISALSQCSDYSRAATIRSTDVVVTIYFSATAMWRLFEGSYYSKYRRRGYYYNYIFHLYRNAATIRGRLLFEVQTSRLLLILFQLYRNAATIRRRLLFEVQMLRLLFISALPQCGDYSRAATIRSTDITATIYFSSTAMRRLPQCGNYSRAATIQSTDVAATIYFSSTAMQQLFEVLHLFEEIRYVLRLTRT